MAAFFSEIYLTKLVSRTNIGFYLLGCCFLVPKKNAFNMKLISGLKVFNIKLASVSLSSLWSEKLLPVKRKKMELWFILFALDVLILPEEVEWIKFNVGMNGYYIVHYEDDGWDSLTGLLKTTHTAISSNDRASLINNAFQLVR